MAFDIFLNRIQEYPRKTLEQSLKEVMQSKNKMIAGKYSPVVYNMKYEEVEYRSLDGVKLYGWLIKNEGATKTIVICHGRTNNRIFTLKYLQLFIDMGLADKYNFFLPDLRNSGKSDEAKTAFGYYFAKDIVSSLIMLKNNFNYKDFIIYGFSQGAMGTAIAVKLYKNMLEDEGINVEKIILDSPVSNIKKIILYHSKIYNYQIPAIFLYLSFRKLNKIIDNKLAILCLSELLGEVPALILQSEKDKVTPYNIVREEFEKLKLKGDELTKLKIFRKGQHVRMYLEYKNEYAKTVYDFLESENYE